MFDATGASRPVSQGAGIDRCEGGEDGVCGSPMLGSIACLGDCIGSAEVAGSKARTGWAQAPAWVWGQAQAVKMTVGTVASRRQASSLGKVVVVESIAVEA
jgi:hypothetical protein